MGACPQLSLSAWWLCRNPRIPEDTGCFCPATCTASGKQRDGRKYIGPSEQRSCSNRPRNRGGLKCCSASRQMRDVLPEHARFFRSNLFYMRSFAAAWDLSQAEVRSRVGVLPWRHIVELLKLKDPELRDWYAETAVEHNWKLEVLEHQIATGLHRRLGPLQQPRGASASLRVATIQLMAGAGQSQVAAAFAWRSPRRKSAAGAGRIVQRALDYS